MEYSTIRPEDLDRPFLHQPETTNHETDSDSDSDDSQQSNTGDISIESFKAVLGKGRWDRGAQREWLKGKDLQGCSYCRSRGTECTTEADVGAKCQACRRQSGGRSRQCSQFDEYLIDYAAKSLDLSESTARDLFRDHGTKGSRRRRTKRASKLENEFDHDPEEAKEEMKATIKKTMELGVQVKTLEKHSQALQEERDGYKKQVSDLLEECENLKRKEEDTERLLEENANATMKGEQLERELGRMCMDHTRYIEEKEEENRMLVEQNRAAVRKCSESLAALRSENESLREAVDKVSELEEKLDELRRRFSNEQHDMVRFQLRVDQVAAILQCTLTPEKLETVKDGRIVKTSLEELKKITQECVMSRVSRGDDVFEMGRNLLTLSSNAEAESTKKRGLDTAKPFKSPQGNKRQRLTED